MFLYFFNNLFFNWRIIALQNFVVFCQTSTWISHQFSSVQSLSHVQLFATPWITAPQASLSITNSRSLLKLMSIESMMPSNHLILCRPLLLPLSSFPASEYFAVSQLFVSGGWSIGASASVFPVNIQAWFPIQNFINDIPCDFLSFFLNLFFIEG